MIEQLVKDPLFLDALNPVGPDFCFYWLPSSGELLTYGWNILHPPAKGNSVFFHQSSPERGSWIELPGHRTSDDGKPTYRIDRIETWARQNPEQNPDGVQRLHWVYLAEACPES